MNFVKSLNNNAALVRDRHQEYVVIGTGISFNLEPGDAVSTAKIQRRFVADDQLTNLNAFEGVSVAVTEQFVNFFEQQLPIKFSNYQYVALADHLDLTLKRLQQAIELPDSAMAWSVRRLYSTEFQVATEAIQKVNVLPDLPVTFPPSETTSLVLHVVNAENKQGPVQDTITITKLIADIVHLVQLDCQITLDATSFNYDRFVTHLKAFMVKRLSNQDGSDTEQALDPSILLLIQTKYPAAYQTVQRIAQYLLKQQGWQLSSNEEVYLTLHVWRVTHRNTQDN